MSNISNKNMQHAKVRIPTIIVLDVLSSKLNSFLAKPAIAIKLLSNVDINAQRIATSITCCNIPVYLCIPRNPTYPNINGININRNDANPNVLTNLSGCMLQALCHIVESLYGDESNPIPVVIPNANQTSSGVNPLCPFQEIFAIASALVDTIEIPTAQTNNMIYLYESVMILAFNPFFHTKAREIKEIKIQLKYLFGIRY